jgi:hypothetical protein
MDNTQFEIERRRGVWRVAARGPAALVFSIFAGTTTTVFVFWILFFHGH